MIGTLLKRICGLIIHKRKDLVLKQIKLFLLGNFIPLKQLSEPTDPVFLNFLQVWNPNLKSLADLLLHLFHLYLKPSHTFLVVVFVNCHCKRAVRLDYLVSKKLKLVLYLGLALVHLHQCRDIYLVFMWIFHPVILSFSSIFSLSFCKLILHSFHVLHQLNLMQLYFLKIMIVLLFSCVLNR